MKSRDAKKLFSAFMEGELCAEEEEALRRHFAECPQDLDEYRAFEAAVQLVRSLPRLEPAPDFTAEVMSKVRRYRHTGAGVRRPARSFIPGLRAVAAMAAMLTLGFISGYLFLSADDGPDGFAAGGATPPSSTGVSAGPAEAADGLLTPEDLWGGLEVPFDRPLRPVYQGTDRPRIDASSDRPTIVF